MAMTESASDTEATIEARIERLEIGLETVRKALLEVLPTLEVEELRVSGRLEARLAKPLQHANKGKGKLVVSAPEHINLVVERTDSEDSMTLTVGSGGTGLHFGNSNFFFISSVPYAQRTTMDSGNELVRIDSNGNVTIRGNLTVGGTISQ